MLRAKCTNPQCPRRSVALPIPDLPPRQRTTGRLRAEAVAAVVADNASLGRAAARLARTFHVAASTSSIDRWKAQAAAAVDMGALVTRLGFSGILCLDEYQPRRARTYDQLAGDARHVRLIYAERVPDLYGRGVTEAFCQKLAGWGLQPHAVIFDMWSTFPRVVRRVWPQALQQYDHFHVKQWIAKYLKNALLHFRRSLEGPRWTLYREELWEHRWGLLKHIDRWGRKEHCLLPELLEVYRGTVVEQVVLFQQELWDLFDHSASVAEATAKRDALAAEAWWQSSWHLTQVMKFLTSRRFPAMITYLDHPEVPRCGQSETLISVWRQMEAAHRGFKAPEGRLTHLKLFQISHYLGGKFP